MNDKIIELLKIRWDKYFCKLAILDHVRECLEKDNYLKATDTPKTDIWFQNLNKELMDLKILLDMYFVDRNDLYETRLNKFLENAKK